MNDKSKTLLIEAANDLRLAKKITSFDSKALASKIEEALRLEAEAQPRQPCYTVVWHGVEPKCWFAGYDEQEAINMQKAKREKYPSMAITIQREI